MYNPHQKMVENNYTNNSQINLTFLGNAANLGCLGSKKIGDQN